MPVAPGDRGEQHRRRAVPPRAFLDTVRYPTDERRVYLVELVATASPLGPFQVTISSDDGVRVIDGVNRCEEAHGRVVDDLDAVERIKVYFGGNRACTATAVAISRAMLVNIGSNNGVLPMSTYQADVRPSSRRRG